MQSRDIFKEQPGNDIKPIFQGTCWIIHPKHCSLKSKKTFAACGLNTVETYVPWNLHEPSPGKFNFKGLADIVRFIETAGELGLHVIVRPGPTYVRNGSSAACLPGCLKTRISACAVMIKPFWKRLTAILMNYCPD